MQAWKTGSVDKDTKYPNRMSYLLQKRAKLFWLEMLLKLPESQLMQTYPFILRRKSLGRKSNSYLIRTWLRPSTSLLTKWRAIPFQCEFVLPPMQMQLHLLCLVSVLSSCVEHSLKASQKHLKEKNLKENEIEHYVRCWLESYTVLQFIHTDGLPKSRFLQSAGN